jgi:hypothetical protein
MVRRLFFAAKQGGAVTLVTASKINKRAAWFDP